MSKIVVDSQGYRYYMNVPQLLQMIQQLDLECDVELRPAARRAGSYAVPWLEFIRISVPWDAVAGAMAGAAVKKILDTVVEWARRGRGDVSKPGDRPPTYISIYGPNGEVLKSVVVETLRGEPRDRTDEERVRARRA